MTWAEQVRAWRRARLLAALDKAVFADNHDGEPPYGAKEHAEAVLRMIESRRKP